MSMNITVSTAIDFFEQNEINAIEAYDNLNNSYLKPLDEEFGESRYADLDEIAHYLRVTKWS